MQGFAQSNVLEGLIGENYHRIVPTLAGHSESHVLVFEAIGDDKVRVTCQSWDDSKVILADEALQVVAFSKSIVVTPTDRPAEYLNIDPSRLADAGYGR